MLKRTLLSKERHRCGNRGDMIAGGLAEAGKKKPIRDIELTNLEFPFKCQLSSFFIFQEM